MYILVCTRVPSSIYTNHKAIYIKKSYIYVKDIHIFVYTIVLYSSSVLQCVAVCCSVLHTYIRIYNCSLLEQCVALCCTVLQCVAVCCIRIFVYTIVLYSSSVQPVGSTRPALIWTSLKDFGLFLNCKYRSARWKGKWTVS